VQFGRTPRTRGRILPRVGFLVRDATGDAVNVVSLKMVAASCGTRRSRGHRKTNRPICSRRWARWIAGDRLIAVAW